MMTVSIVIVSVSFAMVIYSQIIDSFFSRKKNS